MKTKLLILLVLVISFSLNAQEEKKVDVPEEVLSYFNKRFSRAEDLVWDTIHEKNYLADFFLNDINTKVEFTPKGDLVETREVMDPKNIYRPIESFIEEEYPGSKFEYGEKIIRADKDNSFYVQIIQKIKGVKDVPVTELFFDKTGRFEKVIQPEIPEDPKEKFVDETDVYKDDFDAVVESDLKEETKAKKKKKKKKVDEEDGIYERQEVDPRSLPTPILDYVMENFEKLIEFKIKSAEYLENEEMGLHYYLVVAKEGLNQPESELFFTITGGFIKRIDPPEMQEELEEIKEEKMEQEMKVAAKQEKKKEKEEAYEEEFIEEEAAVVSVDVPEAVSSYFSRRFPRAEEVVWEEYGDNNYMASFWYRDTPTKTEFTPDGQLVSTITTMDSKNIYRPVLRYVEENYPDYKIDFGEKALRKDRNHYYYVLIYTKKKKVTPKEIELYFDKVGKIMEDVPEFLQ
jgi:hypothetical protein